MKYIKVDNGKLVSAETEKPIPEPGEVLIKVHAAGVNRADIFQKQGSYSPPKGVSEILGMEVAGAVMETAGEFKKGDNVCAIIGGGGYAEYAVAREEGVLKIPANLDFVKAAGLPEAFFTAWYGVMEKGTLRKGESLLVHGGASGVGIAAIEIAKASGHEVFATAGRNEKCAAINKLGAKAINYKTEDFLDLVKQSGGVDVILDMVGGGYIEKNLRCLKPGGRLVQIAFLESAVAEVNFAPLLMKDLTITAFRMRSASAATKKMIRDRLAKEIWPVIEKGGIIPVIDSVFALEDAEKAHERMDKNLNIGKIILKVI